MSPPTKVAFSLPHPNNEEKRRKTQNGEKAKGKGCEEKSGRGGEGKVVDDNQKHQQQDGEGADGNFSSSGSSTFSDGEEDHPPFIRWTSCISIIKMCWRGCVWSCFSSFSQIRSSVIPFNFSSTATKVAEQDMPGRREIWAARVQEIQAMIVREIQAAKVQIENCQADMIYVLLALAQVKIKISSSKSFSITINFDWRQDLIRKQRCFGCHYAYLCGIKAKFAYWTQMG